MPKIVPYVATTVYNIHNKKLSSHVSVSTLDMYDSSMQFAMTIKQQRNVVAQNPFIKCELQLANPCKKGLH